MRKIFSLIVGIFFILLGIIGLITPIMPGWIFIFAGLSFLAPRLANRLKQKFFRKFMKKDIVYLEDWRVAGVRGGFTTRRFPLVLKQTDAFLDPVNQKKLKESFSNDPIGCANKIKALARCATLNQVHGGHVEVLDGAATFAEDKFHHLPETDGAITNIRELSLLVLTADCLSIFFRAKGWVGLVHAGWRGTRAGVAAKAFKLIAEKSGCKPADVHMFFGPRIGKNNYEVGKEFENYFPGSSLILKEGKLFFDLAGENKRQLLSAGAVENNIFDPEICTVKENENFYSFRKEKEAAGRTISFITRL